MPTFSGLTVPEGHKEERSTVNGEVFKFKYPEVVADDLNYMGSVNNHNALSHDGRTKYQFFWDSAWETTWWTIRVFAFFIAFTEATIYLEMKYFLKAYDSFMILNKNLRRHWLKTPTWMRIHVEVHQTPERENITHNGDCTYLYYWLR